MDQHLPVEALSGFLDVDKTAQYRAVPPLRSLPVLRGSSAKLLRRIHDPAVELVIWQRRLPRDLKHWLGSLPSGRLPDGRVLVGRDSLLPAVLSIFAASSTPAHPMRRTLAEDVAAMAGLFADVMATDLVDLRLEAIQSDACWKFHRDCVVARLLTTYRGPGTEWIQPAQSERALLRQRTFDGRVERFPTHAVGLFKGSCTEPARGIVHRSPPIAGSGAARLLLCLNMPSETSPEVWVG